jgi:3-dehydroquinate dehydratase / shikimate dehydrogenase
MPDPLICETVSGRTMDEVRRARDASGADMVEVRLDGVDRPDGLGAIEGRLRPVVVTCRPTWEGGRFDGAEEERLRILADALAQGAEFVDVEADASFVADLARMRRGNRGLVVSRHFSGGAPSDLAARVKAMRAAGAEVVKIAIEAAGLADVLPLFALAEALNADARRDGEEIVGHVLLAMGAAGFATRVLPRRLGNRWTYAGHGHAPGQVAVRRMVEEFHVRRVAADATLFGVVGRHVLHSLSPVMHNAGFAALGLNAVYVPLEAASADDFVAFARAMRLRGASITAPFKVDMLAHVDALDPLAEAVGAMNTLIIEERGEEKEGGRWRGANTDVEGFLAPLAGRMRLEGARATILGAGGAARAVAVALGRQRAQVTVSARRREAAEAVARLARGRVAACPPPAGSWDILINTTPVGSPGHPGNPMDGARLTGEIVMDLIYRPADTALLRQARAEGCMTITGLEMLVAQAERQFELWTGQRPPAGLFAAAAAGVMAIEEPTR